MHPADTGILPRSGKLEVVATIACLATLAILVANLPDGRGLYLTGFVLVAAGLYPIVVAYVARSAASPMGVPAIGAVAPAAVAVIIGVQAPYTWRDVVVPLGIGLAVLVGTWIAGSMLQGRMGRRVLRLYVLLVLVGGGLGLGFVGVLLLTTGTTNASPF
jgi:hypothetical protein